MWLNGLMALKKVYMYALKKVKMMLIVAGHVNIYKRKHFSAKAWSNTFAMHNTMPKYS